MPPGSLREAPGRKSSVCRNAPAGVLWFEGTGGIELPGAGFTGRLRAPGSAGSSGISIFDRHPAPPPPGWKAPEEFRVLAIVPVYNEEDVIAQTIRDLIAQGLEPYLVDNWSTDATLERARPFLGNGLLGIERFPPDRPRRTYDLQSLLLRIEEIAHDRQWASWVTLHDADERRRSPWPDVRLREAFWHVDRCGSPCVDHVTLNFWPVDNSFHLDGPDLDQHFRYFEFSNHPGHFHQRRAWKQSPDRVNLAATAGHDVAFAGREVYPYKFLLKHYPIRSQMHGERKVLHDRAVRWNPEERALGWHRQYDDMDPANFLRDPDTLTLFDPAKFPGEFLIERLSGVGVFREPPPWATPPLWGTVREAA